MSEAGKKQVNIESWKNRDTRVNVEPLVIIFDIIFVSDIGKTIVNRKCWKIETPALEYNCLLFFDIMYVF